MGVSLGLFLICKNLYYMFHNGNLFKLDFPPVYLTPAGKYWRYKYRFWGKERTLALGVYPEISLKKARNEHIKAKLLISNGRGIL